MFSLSLKASLNLLELKSSFKREPTLLAEDGSLPLDSNDYRLNFCTEIGQCK